MYIPEHFEVTDKDKIFAFIEANAFGQLISNVGGRLYSTHMPFLVSEDKEKILCHLALNNPQHNELEGQEALVTLEGAHDYISPSWYLSPGVPTWNYQSVHIYGHCDVFSEPEKLKAFVGSLTQKFESSFPTLWTPQYRESMLGAIIGVEIEISEIQCKFKLSQNRSSDDRSRVIEKLREFGSHKLATAMEHNEL